MELRQIREAFAAGFAWAVGHSMAMDEDKWVTLKPHGRSVKGTKVRIDEKTNKIEAGAGGNLNGKKLSDLGKAEPKKEEPEKPKLPDYKDPIDADSLKKSVVDIIKNDLGKMSPAKCVRRAARLAFGYLHCKLPGEEDAKVVVNKNFLSECCKYAEQFGDKKLVKSILYGIAYLPSILTTGRLHEWIDGGTRHPGSDFCTITKKYKMGDEIFEVSVDVERNVKKQDAEVHLVNTSFNQPYYDKKKRYINPIASDENPVSYVVKSLRVKRC